MNKTRKSNSLSYNILVVVVVVVVIVVVVVVVVVFLYCTFECWAAYLNLFMLGLI
jgi:hypothetical protein